MLAVALTLWTGTAARAENIAEIAVKTPQLSTLVKLLQAADLVDALKQPGPFTVLAPTNEAFSKVPKETVEALLKPENKEKLKNILLYHVIAAEYTTDMLSQAPVGTSGPALNGQNLILTSLNPVMVNDAKVIKADIAASNGVIHLIDKVLIPTEAATAAPTATAEKPMDKPKLPASNQTIAEIAAGDPQFSILVTALTEAGLVETLTKRGPFTVFAPTNAAFEKLPKETLAALLKPENRGQLIAILTYHLVPGVYVAADVVGMNGKDVPTINRAAKVNISTSGGVKVGGANVVKTDIPAKNGVIHVIDTVLIPPTK
ncbi:MAG: hypothetical protein OHK0029_01560 [Armatimonadaceae bacterium]